MRLLCIDIGFGTQDILLFDSAQPVENSIQLILPAPTQLAAGHIREATGRGEALLLTGVTMGGGPVTVALKSHLRASLPAYATPDAARTFDDDLDEVAGWGVRLVSPDEAASLRGVQVVETKDLYLEAIFSTLTAFGLPTGIDGLAVAVLDHGAAPKGMSDRHFRFQHLRREVERTQELGALCYWREELPDYLTRMRAVAGSAPASLPLLLMDTGTAAALGAGLDGRVARHPHRLSANLGNAHTLAFHLDGERILGLFEHHTGRLTPPRLRGLLKGLAAGELSHQEVWENGGHGALIVGKGEGWPFLAATGPRRGLIARCGLRAYLAAPFGSMMLTGCYGLLRAWAGRRGQGWEEIEARLKCG